MPGTSQKTEPCFQLGVGSKIKDIELTSKNEWISYSYVLDEVFFLW